MTHKILVIGTLLLTLTLGGVAQDVSTLQQEVDALKPRLSRFLLRGYAHSGFEKYEEGSSFVGGSFNPIFLWQQSDRLLFEGELEVELEGGRTRLGLEYANMSFIINKRAIIRVGQFLIPFGIFAERLHPRWINRLPSNPLGFSHGEQVGPSSALGVELRGGAPVGAAKINYAFYVINGPTLNDGSVEPEEVGQLHFDNYEDNNDDKAIGGRFGILPFSNSSLEIGISGQTAKVGARNSIYEDTRAWLYAVDLSFVHNVPALKSIVDIKAQYSLTKVDRDVYTVGPETFRFNNESSAYFVQATFKPAFVSNRFFQKLEFAGRYSAMSLAPDAPWGKEKNQWAISLNYWLDWRTVVKFSYQYTDSPTASSPVDTHAVPGAVAGGGGDGEAAEESGTPLGGAFLIHWSFGF